MNKKVIIPIAVAIALIGASFWFFTGEDETGRRPLDAVFGDSVGYREIDGMEFPDYWEDEEVVDRVLSDRRIEERDIGEGFTVDVEIIEWTYDGSEREIKRLVDDLPEHNDTELREINMNGLFYGFEELGVIEESFTLFDPSKLEEHYGEPDHEIYHGNYPGVVTEEMLGGEKRHKAMYDAYGVEPDRNTLDGVDALRFTHASTSGYDRRGNWNVYHYYVKNLNDENMAWRMEVPDQSYEPRKGLVRIFDKSTYPEAWVMGEVGTWHPSLSPDGGVVEPEKVDFSKYYDGEGSREKETLNEYLDVINKWNEEDRIVLHDDEPMRLAVYFDIELNPDLDDELFEPRERERPFYGEISKDKYKERDIERQIEEGGSPVTTYVKDEEEGLYYDVDHGDEMVYILKETDESGRFTIKEMIPIDEVDLEGKEETSLPD